MAFSRAASVPAPAQSTPFARRTMGGPIVFYSTEKQSPPPKFLTRQFIPIISIDHLSQDYLDLPVDNILVLGDQTLLRQFQRTFCQNQTNEKRSQPIKPQSAGGFQLAYSNMDMRPSPGSLPSNPTQQHSYQLVQDCVHKYYKNLLKNLISMSIDEPDVFGPLVTNLYETLTGLKSQPICEVLLYLSGHGMDPGNLCLIPDIIKPHPARDDLRDKDPAQCYTDECQQDYLRTFYEAFRKIEAYKGPLGFVGGELYVHQRGYVGVLGVLGLWCYAHHDCEGNTYHHLVIVADCCFAGIWGATLERIMKSTEPCLEGYHKLLLKYPVSIQCATNEFEASHGGLFTPLWCFLQNAEELLLESYIEKYKHDHGESVSHDFETQHPWFISTSAHAPSCKCFDNPEFFVYLLGEQRKELQVDLQSSVNRRALEDACTPGTAMVLADIGRRFAVFASVVRPRVTALAGAALYLQDLLQMKERQETNIDRSLTSDEYQAELQRVKESIRTIEQSLAYFSKFLHEPEPRFRRGGFVLTKENKLTKASRRQLMKTLQPRDRGGTIRHGVYVFQGGEGDMSLIVTPGCKQVILIDGTKTADCFKEAWESTLRYLPRITHIFVTHHDWDHTFGIQLLLARYCVEQTDIPDVSSTTIYMNTREGFRPRNFGHEKEICTLANEPPLNLWVESVIVWDRPLRLLHCKDFFIEAILPKQSLVNDVLDSVKGALDGDNTRPVPLRGRTTAANVLSINMVAVWKNRDAYLFTGDAHLKDVTQAAQDFLHIHDMESFKYVDVPHHGSAKSNVDDVDKNDHGLAGIPAFNYLISHCGNRQNPSLTTVTHILKRDQCQKLHFLYPARKQPVSSSCKECGTNSNTRNWRCKCVIEYQYKIYGTLHGNGPFKFFPFYLVEV